MTDAQPSPTVARLRKLVEDTEAEIKRLRENPPGEDAAPSVQASHQKRLENLSDDYRAALNNLAQAERAEAAAGRKVVSPERRTKAQQNIAASKNPNLNVAMEPDEFYQALQDHLDAGDMDDGEATRWHQVYLQQRQEKLNRDREARTAAAQKETARREAAASASTVQHQRELERGATRRADVSEANARATNERLLAQGERSFSLDQRKFAREAGETAVTRAEKRRLEEQNRAYSQARAGGRSPQEALSAAESLPPLDLDAIADRAVERALADLTGRAAPGTSANPMTPPPPPPDQATRAMGPPPALGGTISQAAGAAMATAAAPPTTSGYPTPNVDLALGRFGR